MEHRGVRYDIRRGLGRDEWVWSVYTPEEKAGPCPAIGPMPRYGQSGVIDLWFLRKGLPRSPTAELEPRVSKRA